MYLLVYLYIESIYRDIMDACHILSQSTTSTSTMPATKTLTKTKAKTSGTRRRSQHQKMRAVSNPATPYDVTSTVTPSCVTSAVTPSHIPSAAVPDVVVEFLGRFSSPNFLNTQWAAALRRHNNNHLRAVQEYEKKLKELKEGIPEVGVSKSCLLCRLLLVTLL